MLVPTIPITSAHARPISQQEYLRQTVRISGFDDFPWDSSSCLPPPKRELCFNYPSSSTGFESTPTFGGGRPPHPRVDPVSARWPKHGAVPPRPRFRRTPPGGRKDVRLRRKLVGGSKEVRCGIRWESGNRSGPVPFHWPLQWIFLKKQVFDPEVVRRTVLHACVTSMKIIMS